MEPALLNGRPAQSLPLRDRGFLYGDGLFETVRFHHRHIPLWPRHRQRLQQGLQRLGIALDPACMDSDLQQFFDLPAVPDSGVLRITVTRGEGGRGYATEAAAQPTRLLVLGTLPETPVVDGVTLRLCHWRLAIQPGLAGIKHLNRLDQVMARREWDDPAIFDGLLLDSSGRVIESTACNLFLRSGDEWLTPALDGCGVAGVLRSWLLQEGLPALGIDACVADVLPQQLLQADEVFLCNSVRGIVPVVRLQHPACQWAVGDASRALAARVGAWWHG